MFCEIVGYTLVWWLLVISSMVMYMEYCERHCVPNNYEMV